MAAEIKLTKTDESPWGFRLTGGRDFGTPLTIIKVAGKSVAEEAGLQVGDILIKINNDDSHDLTHKEAQDIIIGSGNAVTFAVLRGNLNLPGEIIDRLTPLPLRDFKTPEPNVQHQISADSAAPQESQEPVIEVIPIKDLDPDQLEELGLIPLPEDFLEKAKRDPSPMPEVRPQSRMASAPDVLDTLEQLGLQEVVNDIERQKPEVFKPPPPEEAPVVVQEETTPMVAPQEEVTPEQGGSVTAEPLITTPGSSTVETPNETAPSAEQQCVVEPITEEEFAEFMSGKTEVLEAADGKNALGVDFKKYEPQGEFLKKSQVFRTLQDNEKIITREEKDKRWTTFLDKPKGPKPVPKPRTAPSPIVPASEPEPVVEEPPSEQKFGLYEIPSQEEFEALVKVPTPLPQEPKEEAQPEQGAEENPEIPSEAIDPNEDNVKQQLQDEQKNLQEQLEIEKKLNPELFNEEKSEMEIQLEEIQRQLEAIQQLPFEIQQHLSLVQEQLNKIVQHKLLEQNEEVPSAPRPSMVEETGLLVEKEQVLDTLPPVDEACQEAQNPTETQETQVEEPNPAVQPVEVDESVEPKKEFKLRSEEEPAILPPPKKVKPQKKRPFLGLGPAPRPLILPGGRKWRTPKDAYNEEFIAETLSAQAEIITGHTLGVNFRKYEPKPPNLEHLRDSIVYKMIHDLEDPDIVNKGLASRAELVPAIQDFNQQSAPAAI